MVGPAPLVPVERAAATTLTPPLYIDYKFVVTILISWLRLGSENETR
jgi:hypothetical protein